MNIEVQLNDLATLFYHRFSRPDVIEQAGYNVSEGVADYVRHSEYGLAFEILCVQLYEFGLPITSGELAQIDAVGTFLYPDGSYKWDYLQGLVQD